MFVAARGGSATEWAVTFCGVLCGWGYLNRIEHWVKETVSQRVYGMALGYEDLNDHELLRHDPLLAVMSGRTDTEAALAGKSTLNRMELSGKKEDRYKKILCDGEAIDRLLVDVFVEFMLKRPIRSCWIWMRQTLQSMAGRKAASSMVSTITTVICRSTSFAITTCWLPVCGNPISTDRLDRWRKSNGLSDTSAKAGLAYGSFCEPILVSAAMA